MILLFEHEFPTRPLAATANSKLSQQEIGIANGLALPAGSLFCSSPTTMMFTLMRAMKAEVVPE